MWDATIDLKVSRSDLPAGPIADPFPDGFDAAIDREIERVEPKAGLEAPQ